MLLEFVRDDRVSISEIALEDPNSQFLDARPSSVNLDGRRLIPLAVKTTVGREIHHHRVPLTTGLLDRSSTPFLPLQPLDPPTCRRTPIQLTF